jgi:hypothetical protein
MGLVQPPPVGSDRPALDRVEHGSRRVRRRPERGGFSTCLSPYLRHDRSRTGAEVMQVRLDQLKLTNLVDQRPRRG